MTKSELMLTLLGLPPQTEILIAQDKTEDGRYVKEASEATLSPDTETGKVSLVIK